jgi:hypothetical protein
MGVSKEEIEYIIKIIEREGYLNYNKTLQDALVVKRNFYTNEYMHLSENKQEIQEEVKEKPPKKMYKIRKAVKPDVVDEKKEITIENTLEESTKTVSIFDTCKHKSVENNVEIIKSDSRETEEISSPLEKGVLTEKAQKVRRAMAIRKYYKNN